MGQTAGDDRGRDQHSKEELEDEEVHQNAARVAEPHCCGWLRWSKNGCCDKKENKRANEKTKEKKKKEGKAKRRNRKTSE